MFQRDYVMRMIEQLTVGMAQIAGLRKEMKQEEGFTLIDELLGRFFRLNSKLVNSLTEKDLIMLMTSNGFVETEKLMAVAALLKEEGDLLESLDRPEESYSRHLKSLQLYLAAAEHGADSHIMDDRVSIEGLISRLQPYILPRELKRRLVNHYERSGDFDKAENWLYDLLDSGTDAVQEDGQRFYNRLLSKSDDELLSGRLPRNEVQEGLAEWRRKMGDAG